MLSYQWNVQGEVKRIEEMLTQRNVKCWMDINGGMKNDIYDSMAEGVQDAACLICFMTQAYQDSVNCKLELKFAQQSGVPIIPIMMQADFAAKGWLAILTAGSIWTPMHDGATVPDGVDNLIIQVQYMQVTHTPTFGIFRIEPLPSFYTGGGEASDYCFPPSLLPGFVVLRMLPPRPANVLPTMGRRLMLVRGAMKCSRWKKHATSSNVSA